MVNPEPTAGFVSLDEFLAEFTALPDIASRLPAARKALQKSKIEASTLGDLRREAGLSQFELANKIGTSQPAISAYEAGDREPSIRVARKIAEALGVSLDELAKAIVK